jgi:hypothetical protein
MQLLLDERTHGLVVRPARPWERFVAGVRTHHLDENLAHGASPEATAPLALRAQALAHEGFRQDLARSAQQILAEAQRTGPRRRPVIPICRDRVREATAELGELISRLRSPGPLPVRGVAQVSVLFGDGRSPLYHRASQDDLRERLREATDALSELGLS